MKLALIFYWSLCFFLTHLPPSAALPVAQGFDKGAHFVGYSLLGLLLCLNLQRRRIALIVLVFYSLVDETTQPFVGRTFEWFDLLSDFLGGLLGISLGGWDLIRSKIFLRPRVDR